MTTERKDYSRSVRMTPTVRQYVEQQKGSGFNEQFENMVLTCMNKQADIEKMIDFRQRELNELTKQIQIYRNSVMNKLALMSSGVESILKNTGLSSDIEQRRFDD